MQQPAFAVLTGANDRRPEEVTASIDGQGADAGNGSVIDAVDGSPTPPGA